MLVPGAPVQQVLTQGPDRRKLMSKTYLDTMPNSSDSSWEV
jgi:hypothetical protein